ncbi:MAG: hypothetical protein ACKOZW_12850, partial [Cyanobium sp.]
EAISEPAEFLFVPPDVPYDATHLSATEPACAVVARNDPAEQDNVVPYRLSNREDPSSPLRDGV